MPKKNDVIHSADVLPIGTLIMRPTPRFISNEEAASFLLCDGSVFDTGKYPELAAVLGSNRLPDLRGRFPQGSAPGLATGSYVNAGLPNITGEFKQWKYSGAEGAFYNNGSWPTGADSKNGGGDPTYKCILDASRSSNIYGRSNTVQPPAMVVNYYIKAL